MSPRCKTDNAGQRGRDPARSHAQPDPHQQTKLAELLEQARQDKKLVDLLLSAEASSATVGLVEQARDRYEQNLQTTCDLLAEQLQTAEAEVQKLQQHNRALRQSNERLTYRLDKAKLELRRALGIKASTRDTDEEKADTNGHDETAETKSGRNHPGTRGAPKGHKGKTRRIPGKVDREQVIAPPETCRCGCCDVSPLLDADVRYVEDIPAVSVEVTRQIYLRGRCANCGKVVRHDEATSRPMVVTGPNLAAHLTMMNQMGVTFRKLATFSTRTLGVNLSPSGALGIINRVAASLENTYADVRASLPHQPWLNGDETGWKTMGRNGYIWCFCNKDMALFHPDTRRSAKVIEEILGDSFAGIVICDFYAAYNCIDNTQRCLVHLLRDIKKERQVLHTSKLLERFEKAVKAFIEGGLEAQAMPDGPDKDRAVARLGKRLDTLTRMRVTKGKATTLVKRIKKYRNDLIRFVTHPAVEFHNNRAERQLRPIVINRKVSFGSNTPQGARRYCVIHTVVETCKLQGIDPIEFIQRAYTSGGLDVPTLTGVDPPNNARTA